MKKIFHFFALLCFSLFFHECRSHHTITSDRIAAIDTFLEIQAEKGFSGSVLISENNRLLFSKGYGFSNRELKTLNDAETLYEVASITKLFTVAAILQLDESDKISVEDEIEKYLGNFEEPKDQATISHLLVHTAGLVPRGYTLNYDSRKRFIESVKSAPPESKPGEKYRYTNAGYTLLAAIIEVTSGLSYENYLTEHIFKPLNLVNTTYGPAEDSKNVAVGYTGNTLDSLQAFYTRPAVWGDRGPGGILTNVTDLYKLLRALEEEKIITNENVQKMLNEQIKGEAYGFHILQKPNLGKVLARGGGLPHFESQIAWYKDKNIKLIFTINNRLRLRQQVWDGIERILFRVE
jgi:CubicO group peptidase (beta-lactamase class C family)